MCTDWGLFPPTLLPRVTSARFGDQWTVDGRNLRTCSGVPGTKVTHQPSTKLRSCANISYHKSAEKLEYFVFLFSCLSYRAAVDVSLLLILPLGSCRLQREHRASLSLTPAELANVYSFLARPLIDAPPELLAVADALCRFLIVLSAIVHARNTLLPLSPPQPLNPLERKAPIVYPPPPVTQPCQL